MIELLCKTDRSIAPLFIRLALGAVMFAHGAQKVFGWWGGAGFTATIDTFTIKLDLPLWMVILLMIIELFGSIGLILGFLTRLSALGIATSMAVCAYLYHIPNGFFMNWFGQQKGEGIEYHVLVLGICVALIIQGGGLLSVDKLLSR